MEATVNKEINATGEEKSPLSLDKRGLIILAVSAAIALVFAIVGTVLLVVRPAKSISLDAPVYEDAGYGETLTYSFKCNESGYYRIFADNAEIVGVSCNGKSVSAARISSGAFDDARRVYMERGYTYEISIQSIGYTSMIEITG